MDEAKLGEQSWFYLTDDGQSHGPFAIDAMKELFKTKYVTEDALVWAEGEPEWVPLKALHALYAALAFQDEGKEQKATTKDADLASFEAEIAAIEGAAAEVESPSEDEKEFVDDDGTKFVWDPVLRKFRPEGVDMQNASTEQGPAAIAPEGAAPAPAAGAMPEYTAEMMVFDQEEEVVPTLQQAQAMQQAELERELQEREAAAAAKQKGNAGSTGEGHDAASADTGKRKPDGELENGNGKKSKKQDDAWFELKTNTSVYVTGIPDDATVEEIAQEFQRCGIIKLDEDQQPRIKIYRDKSGFPKGDCLVTFLRQPSVKLAVTVMDGRQLRPGVGQPMTVQEARFQQKGEFVAKKVNKKNRKKIIEQQERLLGWQGYDDKHKANEVTVILKNMFMTEEIRGQPAQEAELQADVMNECKQFGAIDKLRVFAANPEGVISIRFRTPEAAQGCTGLMNGRFFAGRQIEAFLWDGKTNYNPVVKQVESEEEQAARLEAFAAELEKS